MRVSSPYLLRQPSYDETVIIDGEIIPKDEGFLVMLPRYMNMDGLNVKDIIYISMVDVWGVQKAKQLLEKFISKKKPIKN